MNDNQNYKLFIIKVKITTDDNIIVRYDYEPIYANDAEQALYIWNEERVGIDTYFLRVVAVEVFSTQSVIIIDENEQ